MKFNFKIQQYQTAAVDAVVKIFDGQGYNDGINYIRDLGKESKKNHQVELEALKENEVDSDNDNGFKNEVLGLTDNQLLKNINRLQSNSNIQLSDRLVKDLGRCSLDIEMETGTGKTYVYIKTIFELNKKYGWSKFIIVVPSIAIREGVKKSLEITKDHFMEHYKKKARFFIYNSSDLTKLDEFSSDAGINIMIINTQAFATSLKEGAKNKESRIIYSKRDEFASRRPIDVIAANRPIIILDEPQKMTGSVTQKALQNFNPLFNLNYSATHAKKNNLVYALDALDAYNKRLVKKIEVKGFEVKNFRGTDQYMYLESILISGKKPPRAKLQLEVGYNKSINRETRILDVGDNLYYISNEMEQYKDGFVVSEIDPIKCCVTFVNGNIINIGEVIGDVSETDMRRIQIRETIISHFEKEESLFKQGIKTLSLFFIDEVSKYRIYDKNGVEGLGEYGLIFEEEYNSILQERLNEEIDIEYKKYLNEKCSELSNIHKGYFSIDKKTKKVVDSTVKRGENSSDDISAYDLILKNKERLLSFEEPTRFIFSHSALREGWDNPNVFQICTLKHSDSQTVRRQEVGRGLRLCVNKDGNRMDLEVCGDRIHDINKLTVIASESYKAFVEGLQGDIQKELRERPKKATKEYFEGKIITVNDDVLTISDKQARDIYKYLIKNDYIDDEDNISATYRVDLANNILPELPDSVKELSAGVHTLIQSIYDESVLKGMIGNANETKIQENGLNDNFFKKEFQTLWNYINHKYAYTVEFDSNELIEKSIKHINDKLFVSELQYTAAIGEQKKDMNEHEVGSNSSFKVSETKTKYLNKTQGSNIKYDLLGKIAEGTILTRRSVAQILKGISETKLNMFRNNPEEFITKVIRLIKEQKATMIVEHISYNEIEGSYESSIFTEAKISQGFDKAFKANKHIQDFVFTDGIAEKSIERKFAESLDSADEVCVYAKLPKGFSIPTPVGNYSPDWAIAFKEDTVKHIYFIAETKGTMESLQLRPIEQAKIACAKKLFNEISTSEVVYHDVDSYESLLNVMKSL